MAARWRILAAICLLAASGFVMAADENRMSDREKAGLRGLVETCTDEQELPSATDMTPPVTVTRYDREGRTVSRVLGNGKSRSVDTYTYASDGRLIRMVSEKADGQVTEQRVYSYDDAGRLIGVASGKSREQYVRFAYDPQGRKSAVYTARPKTKEKNVAYGMPTPDGSDQGFEAAANIRCEAFEACASTKIVYNAHDRPTEAQLRDTEGHVFSRFVRTFDEKGNVTAEQQVSQSPELMVPTELQENLNPAQKKSIGILIAAMGGGATTYVYDSQNRVKETRRDDIAMGQEVTTISYNEHGDKSDERTVRSGGQGFSGSLNEDGTIMPGPPSPGMPPEYSETRYTYEYDSYGNWTEEKVENRSNPNEAFRISTIHRRKLSYFANMY